MVSRIFFGSNPTTTNTNDYIDFNESIIPLGNGHIQETTFTLSKIDTTVDNPDPDSLGTYQHTGSNNVEISIAGLFLDAKKEVHNNRKLIRTFGLRNNTSSSFPFGMVGLVLDNFPEFDITPTATRGAIILNIQLVNPIDQPQKLGFVARIRILGHRGTSPNFSWK